MKHEGNWFNLIIRILNKENGRSKALTDERQGFHQMSRVLGIPTVNDQQSLDWGVDSFADGCQIILPFWCQFESSFFFSETRRKTIWNIFLRFLKHDEPKSRIFIKSGGSSELRKFIFVRWKQPQYFCDKFNGEIRNEFFNANQRLEQFERRMEIDRRSWRSIYNSKWREQLGSFQRSSLFSKKFEFFVQFSMFFSRKTPKKKWIRFIKTVGLTFNRILSEISKTTMISVTFVKVQPRQMKSLFVSTKRWKTIPIRIVLFWRKVKIFNRSSQRVFLLTLYPMVQRKMRKSLKNYRLSQLKMAKRRIHRKLSSNFGTE